jgi:hypothetical protein
MDDPGIIVANMRYHDRRLCHEDRRFGARREFADLRSQTCPNTLIWTTIGVRMAGAPEASSDHRKQDLRKCDADLPVHMVDLEFVQERQRCGHGVMGFRFLLLFPRQPADSAFVGRPR